MERPRPSLRAVQPDGDLPPTPPPTPSTITLTLTPAVAAFLEALHKGYVAQRESIIAATAKDPRATTGNGLVPPPRSFEELATAALERGVAAELHDLTCSGSHRRGLGGLDLGAGLVPLGRF